MLLRARCVAVALVGLLTAWPAVNLDAADLNQVLEILVREVRAEMLERDAKSLRVGRFEGPLTSAGRRIETELQDRLKAAGVPGVGAASAMIEIRGTFTQTDVRDHLAATLSVELLDASGKPLASFRQRFDAATAESRVDLADDLNAVEPPASGAVVDDSQDIALLHGATVDFARSVNAATGIEVLPKQPTPNNSANSTETAADKAEARLAFDRSIRDAVVNPQFHSAGTTIASSPDSPFRIEVLATPVGKPQPYVPTSLDNQDGMAFAALREGQSYAIKIYNDAAFDVGVELSIDGINSLTFCRDPSHRQIGKWVVPAGKTGVVSGWLRDAAHLESFLITTKQQGVASSLGRPQGIGMVSAAFFPAWTGDTPPVFERLVAGSTRSIATGRGPLLDQQVQSITRSFGTEPLAIIAVRYVNPKSSLGVGE